MSAPFDFSGHFKTICKHLPQAEPLLYVQRFTMLSSEAWLAKFGPGMPTACCTPEGFWFNQEFWDGLPNNKQCGLILHETFHGALAHLSDPWTDNTVPRRTFHQLANVAQDIVIERAIWELNQKIQPNKAPQDRDILQNYEPEKFMPYVNLTWRQVYAMLLAQAKAQGGGQGEGEGDGQGGGLPQPVCDVSQGRGQPDALAQRWESAVKESEATKERIRSQGSNASGATLDVTPDEPTVPWQTLLTDYLVAQPAPVRKTWTKVKRRPFGATGAYVPSRSGTANTLPSINLLLDTSGSMSADYSSMAGEVLSICAMAERVHRVDYDVGVAYREVIEEPEDYTITKLHGGGGTCIRTTIKQLLEDRDFDAKVPCVVLTDGGDSYDVADLGVACVFLTYGSMFKSDAGPVYEVKK